MEINKKLNEVNSGMKVMILNKVISYVVLLTLLLIGEFLFAQKTNSKINTRTGRFRASVVKEDITLADSQMLLGYDARKSTGVLNHIFHRIVALADGTTQFFLVSTDICEISPG